jgi:hypothetical protein
MASSAEGPFPRRFCLAPLFAYPFRYQSPMLFIYDAFRCPSTPAVARPVEEHIEDCLACLAFPLAHRPRIRTTNGLERLNEEIKRRTRKLRQRMAYTCLSPRQAECYDRGTVVKQKVWLGWSAHRTRAPPGR